MTLNPISSIKNRIEAKKDHERQLADLDAKIALMQQFVEVADRVSKNGKTW